MVWIIVGIVVIVVVAAAVWAFWPSRSGIVDGDVRGLKRRSQGDVENYNNPSGPNFGGPF
ncbi:hypothetical protein [Nocardioides sp.]|uniref:hypothetical protein n=1 Tax=Nocardioides sp. TaxID=35761 RepID=UPI0026098A1D|nr:hypothetical protein [Nocardioides sp.]MDI6908854.1 hypothetical protein [Nocardioides sp.]